MFVFTSNIRKLYPHHMSSHPCTIQRCFSFLVHSINIALGLKNPLIKHKRKSMKISYPDDHLHHGNIPPCSCHMQGCSAILMAGLTVYMLILTVGQGQAQASHVAPADGVQECRGCRVDMFKKHLFSWIHMQG